VGSERKIEKTVSNKQYSRKTQSMGADTPRYEYPCKPVVYSTYRETRLCARRLIVASISRLRARIVTDPQRSMSSEGLMFRNDRSNLGSCGVELHPRDWRCNGDLTRSSRCDWERDRSARSRRGDFASLSLVNDPRVRADRLKCSVSELLRGGWPLM